MRHELVTWCRIFHWLLDKILAFGANILTELSGIESYYKIAKVL